MSDREKLVELLTDNLPRCGNLPSWDNPLQLSCDEQVQRIADHLIMNGVTVQEWIPVTERLPENEVDVLICAQRRYYKGGTIPVVSTAFYTDGKMNTEESGYNWDLGNVDIEYDEEVDAYIVPEGWWESVRYGEEFSAVDDFVTHWMPLPQPPKGE